MTTIIELPNEPKFTIKTVASQTGIHPVTLRAWERRHEILTPYRDNNHYRLYSERDIAILRWLKFRIDEGLAIGSAVNELRHMMNSKAWPEAIPAAPLQRSSNPLTSPVSYARRLSQALIERCEDRAADLLREAHAQFSLMTLCTDVLIPVAQTLEDACYRGEISPSELRFRNTYLLGKLLTLFQTYPSRNQMPLILVGCAPMEFHELSAMILALLLRGEGYRVEYLGPDLAIEDLVDYAGYTQPSMVILSASSEYTAREMAHMERLLKSNRPASLFGYLGQCFAAQPNLRAVVPGVYLSNTPQHSLEVIQDALRRVKVRPERAHVQRRKQPVLVGAYA